MKKSRKKLFIFFLSALVLFTLTSCKPKPEPKDEIDLSYRVGRSFEEAPLQTNEIDEENLPKVEEISGAKLATDNCLFY